MHDYVDVDVAILLEKDADKWKERSIYWNAGGDHEDRMLDISVLNEMPLDTQRRVLNEGEVLYVKDKPKLYDYSIGIVNRWADFSHRLDAVLNG